MMLLPDMRTIFTISVLVNIMLALLMLAYWRTQKTYPGFGIMTMTNAFLAMTFLMFAFRSFMPELLSVLLANLSAALAVICRYEGIKRFLGEEKPLRRHAGLILVLLAFATFYTLVHNSVLIRSVGMSFFICFYLLRILFTVNYNEFRHGRALLRAIAAFLFVYFLLIGSRALYWLCNPDSMTLYTSSLPNLLFFLYDLLHSIGLTMLYIMLNGQRMAGELTEMQQKLEILAAKDSLTGFNNNRTFREIGQKEMDRARRFNHPLSLLMIDVDNFKDINDTYGHVAGDRVLEVLARRIESLCRSVDIAGRMGGDEFVLLLPETSARQAVAVAERLQAKLLAEPIEWDGKPIPVTISVGTAELDLADEFNMLLKRADDAMYEAKRTGRNKVVAL